MTNLEVRDNLKRLAGEHGIGYAALSRMLRRNQAYIQQFVTRGSPVRLEEDDRKLLASFFQVDEALLGGPAAQPMVRVGRMAVQASAGPGELIENEFAIGSYAFDQAWLRGICKANPSNLSIIRVSGDSMAPTLADGDDVLVDHSDVGKMRDGIYVLRRDDSLMVKRLALAPSSATLTISSDNPAYPTWRDCALDSVTVVGRVVWAGRRLS
uniref:S24 family peptidase n=1 Tax=uncultured Sphingomonas sp. TaxID=158754 RepID=UPI0035CB1A51